MSCAAPRGCKQTRPAGSPAIRVPLPSPCLFWHRCPIIWPPKNVKSRPWEVKAQGAAAKRLNLSLGTRRGVSRLLLLPHGTWLGEMATPYSAVGVRRSQRSRGPGRRKRDRQGKFCVSEPESNTRPWLSQSPSPTSSPPELQPHRGDRHRFVLWV